MENTPADGCTGKMYSIGDSGDELRRKRWNRVSTGKSGVSAMAEAINCVRVRRRWMDGKVKFEMSSGSSRPWPLWRGTGSFQAGEARCGGFSPPTVSDDMSWGWA